MGDLRIMTLTRNFKETIQARIKRDPAFREELFKEGIECLLSGDVGTGKAVLRDYINATVGFQELGGLTAKSPKSLMRMFGPNGNPQARNLFEVIGCLQKCEGLHLKVQSVRQSGLPPKTCSMGKERCEKLQFHQETLVKRTRPNE